MNSTVPFSLIAAGAATFLAFVSASQTYLSMLNHGHSFVRMFTAAPAPARAEATTS